ncbi:MAG: hypothetical protein SOS93_06460, partial [Mannheimia varigena]|nr:hypothetical protein [Mannheimia varigena]
MQKALARILFFSIMHVTQRRTVVKRLSLIPVRRFILFFNNLSDNLCGHLLIDLILKNILKLEV